MASIDLAHDESALDLEACTDMLAELRMSELAPQIKAVGSGLYLLVDPLLGDPLMPEALQAGLSQDDLNAQRGEVWQRPAYALTLPPALPLDAAHAPYLVELQGAQDPWVSLSVQWAVQETVQTWGGEPGQPIPHRVGGWLQSAAFGPQLAQALSELLCLRTQAYTKARYLRLADRRVLSLTVHVLGEAAMASSLSPVQRWHWLDPHAAWRCLGASQADMHDQTAYADSQPRYPITFTQAQWTQMATGEIVHANVVNAIQQRLAGRERLHPAQWAPLSAAQWQAALVER